MSAATPTVQPAPGTATNSGRGNVKQYGVLYEHYRTIAFQNANPFEPNYLVRDLDPSWGNLLPGNLSARILDVGCGMGQFLQYLKMKGYSNLMGVELSPDQAEFCREHVTPNVILTSEVISFLAERPKSFDCIILTGVIEHLPRQQVIPTLSAIFEALAPGGAALIQTANFANPGGMFVRYIDFTHESGFTEISMRQVLRAVGFSDCDITVSGNAPVIYSWRSYLRSAAQQLWHAVLKLMYVVDRGWRAAPKILAPELVVRAVRARPAE